MQVFLKKVFRKDIIAIIQNITNLIINWLNAAIFHKASSRLQKTSAQFKAWQKQSSDKLSQWLLRSYKQLQDTIKKTILRNQLSTPIIIYQPGKVGSITVYESLKIAYRELDLDPPVYHAHNLNYIHVVEKIIKESRKDPAASLKKLAESKALRQKIHGSPFKKWKIISLVRDPIALRVSTMFQVLDEYIPNWAEQTRENKLSIEDLQHLLISTQEFQPAFLASWFNNQIKDLFGFDVFATPFDVEKGFKIYKPFASRFSFMIIRLEDLDRVAPHAFKEFTHLENFRVINQNIGDQKPYHALYKRFKTTPLPAEYLEAAYKTKYARHFYSPEELEIFYNRWLGKT